MGSIVMIDDTAVWHLRPWVASMLVRQARCMEATFSEDSGVGDHFDDQVLVDGSRFAVFLNRLIEIHADHDAPAETISPIRSMLGGFIGVALVLAHRAGLQLDALRGEVAAEWEDIAGKLAPRMPY